jgi:hypothetical protein
MAPATRSTAATHEQEGDEHQQGKQAGNAPEVADKPHEAHKAPDKSSSGGDEQLDDDNAEESKHDGDPPAKGSDGDDRQQQQQQQGASRGSDDTAPTASSLPTASSDPSVSGPSSSDTPSSAAASIWTRPRQVTRAEYAKWSASALVEMSGFTFVDSATQIPALWEVPPEHTTGSPLRLIGVPADESAVAHGARLRNGYGGLEALQAIEMFSAQDLQDLEAAIQADNLQGLLPEFTTGPPSDSVMATMLGALTIQHEFASLLTTFRPDRLAERVFNLMTALKRLLAQHRLVALSTVSRATQSRKT